MDAIRAWISSFFAEDKCSIPDEKMEEFRMLSGFKTKEINRLHHLFLQYTDGCGETLRRDVFLNLECIVNNPLKDRIANCFGYDEETSGLDFQAFLVGVALFNSPSRREQKLKTAFRIQDFDNDGVLNKSDLVRYITIVSGKSLDSRQIAEVADLVLKESASDALQESLTFSDFTRVVAPLDFQARLLLPF